MARRGLVVQQLQQSQLCISCVLQQVYIKASFCLTSLQCIVLVTQHLITEYTSLPRLSCFLTQSSVPVSTILSIVMFTEATIMERIKCHMICSIFCLYAHINAEVFLLAN